MDRPSFYNIPTAPFPCSLLNLEYLKSLSFKRLPCLRSRGDACFAPARQNCARVGWRRSPPSAEPCPFLSSTPRSNRSQTSRLSMDILSRAKYHSSGKIYLSKKTSKLSVTESSKLCANFPFFFCYCFVLIYNIRESPLGSIEYDIIIKEKRMEVIIDRERVGSKVMLRVLAVTLFVALTALSAFVRIPLPFTPVPFTLQTLFVLLSGSLLGRRLGSLAQGLYMLLGLTGLQVFTGAGSGSLYLFGPTGGYIAGFIPASFLAGYLCTRGKQKLPAVFAGFLFADLVLLLCGTLWLKVIISCSLSRAFLLGFLPFVPGDILKVIFAALIHRKLSARIKTALF